MTRWKTLLAAAAALVSVPAQAQLYESGSTGVLGALAPTESVKIDVPDDGVLNYTEIDIPAGVTVTFKRNRDNTPVYLLASDEVNIAGTIDVAGRSGVTVPGLAGITHLGGIGGPGGSDGGSYGASGGSHGVGPGPGAAPVTIDSGAYGGGGASLISNGYGLPQSQSYYNDANKVAKGGTAYGDAGYQPLHGGSGGAAVAGYGGGGGGGVIVIASSKKVTLTGTITAKGGATLRQPNAPYQSSGSGGGGIIRIAAPEIRGTGTLEARGGTDLCYPIALSNFAAGCGGDGLIRLEAYDVDLTLEAKAKPGVLYAAPQKSLPFPIVQRPVLRVQSVAGKTPVLGPNLGHTHQVPGLSLPVGSEVTVVVEASYVPLGTKVKVSIGTLGKGRQEYTTDALAGTLAKSTASVNLTIPAGTKIGTVEAWIPAVPLPKE